MISISVVICMCSIIVSYLRSNGKTFFQKSIDYNHSIMLSKTLRVNGI